MPLTPHLKLVLPGVITFIVMIIAYHLTTSRPTLRSSASPEHPPNSVRNQTPSRTTARPITPGNNTTAVAADYDNMSQLPSDVVLCAQCNPLPANRSTVYRQPKGFDVEDNTAVAYNPKGLFSAPNICPKGKHEMIVAITTHPDRSVQRAAIRDTWGSLLKKERSTKIVFFQGVVEKENETFREYYKHKDIVMDAFSTRNFGSPALQTALILYWLKQCNHAKMVLKIPDETFVNVRLLLQIKDKLVSAPADVFGRFAAAGNEDVRLEKCAYFFKTSGLTALNKATSEVLLEDDDGAYMAKLSRVAGLRMFQLNESGVCNSAIDDRRPCHVLSTVTVHPVTAKTMTDFHRIVRSKTKCKVLAKVW